jgi:signal transduction histidine kinase
VLHALRVPAREADPGSKPVTPRPAGSGESGDPALRAVSAALLGLAGDLSIDTVLERLVHAALELVGARYAALGTPDADGDAFSRFITAGMDDDLISRLGPLPRTHGLLGAMLEGSSVRTADITADPRFRGWWPDAHPRMRSLLGVPIVFRGDVIGAFYLTDKVDADEFDADDQIQIERLAAHAAVLIDHALLFELAHETTVAEERNRLSRDLHDALTQTLFSLRLTLAAGEVDRATALVDEAIAEVRTLVFELRPASLERDGFVSAVRSVADLAGRVHGVEATVTDEGFVDLDPPVEDQLYRVVQEAITNAVRHANARSMSVRLADEGGRAVIEIGDDGVGFDPQARSIGARRLGLTSMRERTEALGGRLTISSVAGEGTTVRAEVPHD